ncbi:MAG: DUF4956 domain-containing protein [Ruminococcus sp.]|nr:DUF4956 domain-containing protein [Ruminococcus sp.]
MFQSVLTSTNVTVVQALICIGTALVLGVAVSIVYGYKSSCSKNFAVTLSLLPSIVGLLIMMVNGNLGTGIAVLGVFSLVRFRSQPGNSREILAVMLSMAIGLATGTGYVTFAIFASVIICAVWLVMFSTPFGKSNYKELRITIPENLDYEGIFDEDFLKFTKHHELYRIKTTQMGTLYELKYHIVLKKNVSEKELIDSIRYKNGNLPVICSRISDDTAYF